MRVSMLKIVFAHPFFISGMACPAMPVPSKMPADIFISSPHATPTMPSYLAVFKIFEMHELPGNT